ncbi:uncharacterized protein LOC123504602 [Portunus trituberculatus]|uniref:uncharacterized protein LOC123504602 n=1 Tax=Portunus trituberculatus TaxID=210409 RepID=UPI001E1CECF7|nr:uncharacterized protein LOC123504602 [Portunus trituberculatus]
MAGITSRFVARTLTSIHTTPSLRSSTRAISSFKGLQSLAQPGRLPAEEVEEVSFVRQHLDALSFWHEESEKMAQARLTPSSETNDIQEKLREQVVELLEELVETGVMDARTGWLAESHA